MTEILLKGRKTLTHPSISLVCSLFPHLISHRLLAVFPLAQSLALSPTVPHTDISLWENSVLAFVERI